MIQIDKITKTFGNRVILKDYSLEIPQNSFTVIAGPSGSGKSTLLNIMGLLDVPDSGNVTLLDQRNLKPFSRSASTMLRKHIGYLFQNFALVPEKTVEYNLKIAMEGYKHSKDAMIDALKQVGLPNILDQYVYQCSGGEQQRIAIARLLLKPCDLILADEPTGSLDEANKYLIFDLLKTLQKLGKTLVIVTHDPDLIAQADNVIYLEI
ncbi:ATP-binding cassette domain-containing protein [Erysipelothrix rhusiopathiae]|uniref:ATP-binding cassette domain-containing protein n=1 Tax=Erysipelothrix rhusiopathiae TaxID=1648 RepID=UPI002B2408CC|nr:ATP-binding cassette domain-containing protein [Erysipelothrix rhusiopathiae]WRB92523.1 ATP-binding cassette domain-containing protein [Erysipelothrix rhusiopathiae]